MFASFFCLAETLVTMVPQILLPRYAMDATAYVARKLRRWDFVAARSFSTTAVLVMTLAIAFCQYGGKNCEASDDVRASAG
jgi:hypothetical protein